MIEDEIEKLEPCKSIFSTSRDFIAILDTEYRYRLINEALCRLLNRDMEEMIGRRAEEFLGSRDASLAIEDKLERCLRGEILHYQGWFESDSEDRRFLDLTCLPFRNESQKSIVGIIVNGRDISELAQSLESLQIAESRIQLMCRAANIGLWDWNLHTGKVVYSPEWKRQIGYDDHEIGDDYYEWESRVHPEDVPGAKERVRKFLDDPWPEYTNEFRFLHKDGSYRWIMATASLLFDDHGQAERMVGAHIDITERKNREERLQQSEEILRKSQRVAQIGSWWYDPETTFPEWSEEIYRIFDLDPNSPPPDLADHKQYIHPEDWSDFERIFTRAVEQGKPYNFEFRIVASRGGVRHVHAIGQPVIDEDGSVAQVVGTLQNITERKRAEEAYHASQKRYRHLFQSIRDAIMVADIDRVIIDCNEAFVDLFGYARDEIIGKKTSHVYANEQRFAEIGGEIRKHMGDASIFHTIEYQKRSGEVFFGETFINYLTEERGEVYGFIGLIRDITEKLENERRVRQNESRFRLLVENLFDAVVVITRRGDIRFANRAACRLFDRSAEELVGSPFGFPISVGVSHQIDILQKSGTIRYGELKVAPADWEDEEIFLASIRDTTNQVLARLEREKHQENLQQLQKLEAIGTLAGGIAHDFNNILTPIVGFTELARDRVKGDEIVEDCLAEVYQSATRARDLVSQILTFSRQGRETYKPILVEPIVREVLKLIRSAIPTSIAIHQDIRSSGMIIGDETEIHQILMNLCTNAGHAMEEEGGELRVGLYDLRIRAGEKSPLPEIGPGRYVHLRVEDNGFGMKRSLKDKIFEPYFTTKDKEKGTGLGLSVVHGIVRNQGGAIGVESEIGRGTTFDIYLPQTISKRETKLESEEDLTGGSEHILVVDDEPSVLKLNTKILESLGYQVSARSSSTEALAMFKERHREIDLLLTDMTMPGMDGYALASECIAVKDGLAVILVTGFSAKINEEKAKEAGITEFLLKPVTKGQLSLAVRQALEKPQPTAKENSDDEG